MARRTAASSPPPPEADALDARPLVERAINRALSDQYAAAAHEVERIVEATYRVIERDGTIDPRIRDILEEAGLATQAFYRHFRSKDELLLVLLDDGRRRLAQYLRRRMEKADGPVEAVRAWIEGILAQAADPDAAARTRPFVTGLQRLEEKYPDEQQASVALLVDMLETVVVAGIDDGSFGAVDPALTTRFIYELTVGVMESHLLQGTHPGRGEVGQLVSFCLRGLATT